VTVDRAQEAVTVLLRELRHLRPGDKSTFDFITQDQILDIFDKLTGAFFLVMIVLSSVGLMVGGIGVMAIMMVSVTDRTREIGVRKALGATRQDIMLQFLIEALVLCLTGGVIGIVVGAGAAILLSKMAHWNVLVSPTSIVIAFAFSAIIGLFFGIWPARRAASLDPIIALRYE
jgi:putative ABC transport system permease protein